LLCVVVLIENAVAQDIIQRPVVYRLPAMETVIVKKDVVYKTVDGVSLKKVKNVQYETCPHHRFHFL
jgi:hypothetical protein